MNTESMTLNRERAVKVLSGWLMLPVMIVFFFAIQALLIYSIWAGVKTVDHPLVGPFVLAILFEPVWFILLNGFFHPAAE
jgi:hypothetical protein